ncbi:potassium-transporting ATPase subunit KdpC [Yinghuangia sp. ASG 101]|uniref:potassium-transporting ATPase subunit KdpC n=1 Tax=Yinghuangia sp. ASG 101 TaxID=2896848 RepID=UPI001E41ADA5|nr:potassium-transporting ATPase subunit KdpC [Yinghuangia sp. ASG 101]UGQ11656.1 potassium-transporting ATPase subunit KdpC [Yinghuangia sp. ASG 101]
MTTTFLRQALAGLRVLIVLTVVTGGLYPLAVWAVAQGAFDGQADGSKVNRDGRVVGSSLIGQNFTGPQWFQPRPSAAGANGYDPLASGASNLGPENPALLDAVETRRAEITAADQPGATPVPPDALTASGSGLDPHISPAYARLQAPRVAQARGLAPQTVEALVDDHVEGRVLGFLGESRVNVLELNLALDRLTPGR